MSDPTKEDTSAANTLGGSLDLLDAGPANEGRDMTVLDKHGNPILHADGRPFTVTLYGSESAIYQNTINAQGNAQRERFNRTRRMDTAEVGDKQQIDLLVKCTKTWNVSFDGKTPAPSTPEEYRKAYVKYPDLRRQVNEFVGNVANFVKTSSPN